MSQIRVSYHKLPSHTYHSRVEDLPAYLDPQLHTVLLNGRIIILEGVDGILDVLRHLEAG